ncbi:MAG: MGH1-like glycoside hydrolase domain-containing protein, partial [Polyangiales bacterium]
MKGNPEADRLEEANARKKHWKRWGPYLAERAWGTVREDYSESGAAWEYFPHDHARSRAYRWNEDGIAGICDRHQRVCFALAMWNGRDPILKERLFGLAGPEGNHGEDVKELYWYVDSTPTHSYMRHLYKYPQAEFPYGRLTEENRRRGKQEPEFELLDTGVFDQDRYFDVVVEYAKAEVEDLFVTITIHNRGPDEAAIWLLPTVWFRNTWSWGRRHQKPDLHLDGRRIQIEEPHYGHRWLYVDGDAELLFTENESNAERLFGAKNPTPYVKDAFHRYVVNGDKMAVNPAGRGTKAAALRKAVIPAGGSHVMRLRLSDKDLATPFADYEEVYVARRREADRFYEDVIPRELSTDAKNVMRQALAGLLWSKQFYH